MEWLQPATLAARKQWANWKIIRMTGICHHSARHPYCAIHRRRWLQDCQEKAEASGVEFCHALFAQAAAEKLLLVGF